MSSGGISGCAIYARYSSEQQRPASIGDQIRKCSEYAERNGWSIKTSHIYTDEAQSGVGSDRPGLKVLLNAAFTKPHPFDIVLVDDTSRLSRSLVEVVQIQQRMAFEGLRIVAVSQGIDSLHEQAELLFAIHGIVDSLYVKELAKKTHRGLEGLALKGFHTGGRCYGYPLRFPPSIARRSLLLSRLTLMRCPATLETLPTRVT